jgi:hypothetical protein
MAITVRQVVEEIVRAFPDNGEVDVDLIESAKNFEIDRIDIVAALKEMEEEGLGVFWKGRRGRKTRFIKGAKRIPADIDQLALSLLREEVLTKPKDYIILVSFDECAEKLSTMDSSDCEDILIDLDQYKDRIDAVHFFGGKVTKAVDALKALQDEGLGVFCIGRRGKFSRFICGTNKEEMKNKPKGIALKTSVIEKDSNIKSFNVINGVIFKALEGNGKFPTIKEAIDVARIENISLDIISAEVDKYGYFAEAVYVDKINKNQEHKNEKNHVGVMVED